MTLIEKITASLIIGTLAAIALPSFSGFVAAQEVSKDADKIQFSLRDAQSEATKKKYQSQFVLNNCTTDALCLEALHRTVLSSACMELAAQLNANPFLQLAYQPSANLALFEDGSCLLNTTSQEVPTASEVYVLPAILPAAGKGLLSQPSSAQSAGKGAKTAPTDCKPVSRGCGRRDKSSAKKPRTQKIKYKGCFHANGTFRMQKNGQWYQVDFSSLPSGVEINATGKLCSELGVN